MSRAGANKKTAEPPPRRSNGATISKSQPPRLDAANLAGITSLMNTQHLKNGINLEEAEKHVMGKNSSQAGRKQDVDPVSVYTKELNQLAEELGIDLLEDPSAGAGASKTQPATPPFSHGGGSPGAAGAAATAEPSNAHTGVGRSAGAATGAARPATIRGASAAPAHGGGHRKADGSTKKATSETRQDSRGRSETHHGQREPRREAGKPRDEPAGHRSTSGSKRGPVRTDSIETLIDDLGLDEPASSGSEASSQSGSETGSGSGSEESGSGSEESGSGSEESGSGSEESGSGSGESGSGSEESGSGSEESGNEKVDRIITNLERDLGIKSKKHHHRRVHQTSVPHVERKRSDRVTDEQERRRHINGVISDLRGETRTTFGVERERVQDIKASKLEQIGQLRMTLEEEGIDCASVTNPSMESPMEEIDSVLNILRLKNDRNRYASLAEEVILGAAEGVEAVFDGTRAVPIFGWRPDYSGYHSTVNVKLHRMRFETSQVVGNIIEKYNIGATSRIIMELLPSFFLYPRQQRKQRGSPGLSNDPHVADARHAMSAIRSSDERRSLDDVRRL
jgi:hypothetical protein